MKKYTNKRDEEPPSKGEASLPPPVSHGGALSFFKFLKNKYTRLWGSRRGKSLEKDVVEFIQEHDPEGEQVSSEERTLLHNVFQLGSQKIEDIMVPRADIDAVEDSISLKDLKNFFLQTEHTRIPVYTKSLDNVIGFLHIKDLLSQVSYHEPFKAENIIREILFVPPSMKAIDLMIKMKTKRVHIAVVVDEYGGTDGLVTLEDIVEEIVGEIEDEHDGVEEKDIVTIDDTSYMVNARSFITDVEKKLQISIMEHHKDEDFDTIGGLIFFLLGRIPEKGESIQHPSGLIFEISDADQRRIHKIIIYKTKPLPNIQPS